MSIDWNLYEKRLKLNGNTSKERQINDMKNLFSNHYKDSPSCRSAYFNGSTIATDIWVIDTNTYGIKTILSMPDETFNVGDVVVYDDLIYLVITIDKDNSVQTKGQIELCNNTLSILKDNILHHVPCIIESNVRFQDLRVQETRFIVTPDDKITARIPNNEITKDISRNLIFKLSDYDNYKIISVNRVTEPGLIVLKFEYVAEEAIEHNFVVEILNGDSIEIQENTNLQLNVEVKDNGNIMSPTPVVVYTSNDENICTVDDSGLVSAIAVGNCVITASSNGVSDSIGIGVIENVQHNITVEITSGNSSIVVNKSSAYACTFRDNGIDVPGTSVFYLTADDGVSSTDLATISNQDSVENTCIVTAGNSVGYVKLFASNESGTIVSPAYRIQIKPLF